MITDHMKSELAALSDDALAVRCREIVRLYRRNKDGKLEWFWLEAGQAEAYRRGLSGVWQEAFDAIDAEEAGHKAANKRACREIVGGKP